MNNLFVLSFAGIVSLGCITEPAFSQNPDSIPFAPPIYYPGFNAGWSVTVSDLDGDEDEDLATVGIGSNQVSVLMNKEYGVFSASVEYETESGPISVFSIDLDSDGNKDLAVTNSFSNTLTILKNNGNGTFMPRVDYTTQNNPVSVFGEDFDNDGDQDLVVANKASNSASIFINDGITGFGRVDYALGGDPSSVFVADLDGDGAKDLIFTLYSYAVVKILKNQGNGTFFDSGIIYVGDEAPSSVFVSDIDLDGDLDLAVASFDGNFPYLTLSVLKNNGNGSFAPAVYYSIGQHATSVFASDLDGDGAPELAVANFGGFVSILKNNGIGGFTHVGTYGPLTSPRSIVISDVDGDMDNDLAVANSNGVSVFENLSCLFGHSIIFPLRAKALTENESLSFRVLTNKGCLQIPVLSALNLPPNSSFYDSGNGSGVFTFTPDFTQSGTYYVTFTACDTVACDSETVQITVLCGETKRGDVNGNGYITLGDVIYLVNYIFKGGPPPVPEKCDADANNDGKVTLADVIYLVNFIFRDATPPLPITCCE